MPSADIHPPRPSSRLAAFAPFRRSTHLATSPGERSPGSAPSGLSVEPNAGGVADVPPPIHGKAPNKPPKPAGLRVRKARALSISLLGSALPGHNNGGETSASAKRNLAPPASANATLQYTSLQQALASEDDGGRYPQVGSRRGGDDAGRVMPPRSVSALDFYRANGPTKGLGSAGHGDLSPAISGPSNPQARRHHIASAPRNDVDDLFIISRPSAGSSSQHERRRSISLTSKTLSVGQSSSTQKEANQAPQGWSLDTARELLAASRSGDSASSPPKGATTSFSAAASKLPSRTQGSTTATPFLNPYTARAKLHGKQEGPNIAASERQSLHSQSSPPSRIPKRTPNRLGKADILKSTLRTSSEYVSPESPTPSTASSVRSASRRSREHSRTASASDMSSSPSRTRLGPRIRTQSHAFGDPVESADRAHDGSTGFVPQHPLSASGSPPAKWASIDRSPMSGPQSSDPSLIAPPPLRRNRLKRLSTYDGLSSVAAADGSRSRQDDRQRLAGANAASNPTLQALGQQIGGMGAAVGKRGWDMFKQWSAGGNTPASQGINSKISPFGLPSPTKFGSKNEATKRWLAVLNGKAVDFVGSSGHADAGPGGVFGRPLRDAVILTRLRGAAHSSTHVAPKTSLDLGSEFKIDLPELNLLGSTNRSRLTSNSAVDRQVARLTYLPGLIVRCIESVEAWGVEEEGIYRLSGRSSHTAKLRQIFDAPCSRRAAGHSTVQGDLRLMEVGPGDLDLNSVCSLLKAYLRDLPDSLIPRRLTDELNDRLQNECGINAVGLATLLPGSSGHTSGENLSTMEQAAALKKASAAAAAQSDSKHTSVKIAEAALSTIQKLPAVNWYLLRELVLHLSDLSQPGVVTKTRMPLSNLCLVLAPTMSVSVPLLRALVDQKDMLFSRSQPSADFELDDVDARGPLVPQFSFTPSPNVPRTYGSKTPTSLDDEMKRMSVATITDRSCAKRESTSSIATVQGFRAAASPTSDRKEFTKSIETNSSLTLLEENDPSLISSPIAAQFIRRRKASISGSLDFPMLDGSSSSSDGFTFARRSSIPQSLPRANGVVGVLNDNDSIHSSVASHDDYSSASSSVMNKASNGSLRSASNFAMLSDPMQSSSSIGSGSALDRPRPLTRGSAKFVSAGRPASKSVSRSVMTSSDTMGSSLSHMSSSGLSSPSSIASKRDRVTLFDADLDLTVTMQPTADVGQRLIDDAPMNVKAVRQYWDAQHRRGS